MKQAVCILIPSIRLGEYIAVTRKDNDLMFGFPGGKVDRSESCEDAMVRETSEEVFMEVDRDQLIPLFSDVCPGEVTYWVTTYLYPYATASGDLKAEKGLLVKAVSRRELCDPTTSPFAAYNLKAFMALDRFVTGF